MAKNIYKCEECGERLEADKGEVFPTDGGSVLCNDHYQDYLCESDDHDTESEDQEEDEKQIGEEDEEDEEDEE